MIKRNFNKHNVKSNLINRIKHKRRIESAYGLIDGPTFDKNKKVYTYYTPDVIYVTQHPLKTNKSLGLIEVFDNVDDATATMWKWEDEDTGAGCTFYIDRNLIDMTDEELEIAEEDDDSEEYEYLNSILIDSGMPLHGVEDLSDKYGTGNEEVWYYPWYLEDKENNVVDSHLRETAKSLPKRKRLVKSSMDEEKLNKIKFFFIKDVGCTPKSIELKNGGVDVIVSLPMDEYNRTDFNKKLYAFKKEYKNSSGTDLVTEDLTTYKRDSIFNKKKTPYTYLHFFELNPSVKLESSLRPFRRFNITESAYGDKRNYPKIDIFEDGEYVATTTWAKTCKEAEERYKEEHPKAKNVKARKQRS